MADGFMWLLEKGSRFKTIILYQRTVITVVGQVGNRQIEVHNHPTTRDAHNAALWETDKIGDSGLELVRVYGCRGDDRLRLLVHDARLAYANDSREVGGTVDKVIGAILGHSTVLYPTWVAAWTT